MAYSYETSDAINYGLLKTFAKELKRNPTKAEAYLWEYLKASQLGKPFRRQHIIGNYIADFFCLPTKTVVEIDGGYHQLPEQMDSDEERTKWLNRQGYSVIRFTNEEVLFDTQQVINRIKENINEYK